MSRNQSLDEKTLEGHEIAAAVLCPFVQSEGENHANQKTVRKQWNIPYQNDLENQSALPCHKRLQPAPRQGPPGSKNRHRMRSFAQHSQKELSRPTAHPQGRRRKGKPVVPIEIFSGASHSRCGRQEGLAHPRPCMAARFSLRIGRLVCQQSVHGARTKCGRHFAGFAPAAHLGCSRMCGACGNDC